MKKQQICPLKDQPCFKQDCAFATKVMSDEDFEEKAQKAAKKGISAPDPYRCQVSDFMGAVISMGKAAKKKRIFDIDGDVSVKKKKKKKA